MPAAGGTAMPATVADGFADAMSQAMLLPALVLVIGVVAVLFFERPATHARLATQRSGDPAAVE